MKNKIKANLGVAEKFIVGKKNNINQLNGTISEITGVQIVPKGWGKELWIHNDDKYCGKILILNQGKKCSLHFHVIKHETFYISKGQVQMEIIEKNGKKRVILMGPGESLEISPGLIHRFTGLTDAEIIEFSTEHFDDDSYRVEKGD